MVAQNWIEKEDSKMQGPTIAEYWFDKPIKVKRGHLYYIGVDAEAGVILIQTGEEKFREIATGKRTETLRDRLFREFWEMCDS